METRTCGSLGPGSGVPWTAPLSRPRLCIPLPPGASASMQWPLPHSQGRRRVSSHGLSNRRLTRRHAETRASFSIARIGVFEGDVTFAHCVMAKLSTRKISISCKTLRPPLRRSWRHFDVAVATQRTSRGGMNVQKHARACLWAVPDAPQAKTTEAYAPCHVLHLSICRGMYAWPAPRGKSCAGTNVSHWMFTRNPQSAQQTLQQSC